MKFLLRQYWNSLTAKMDFVFPQCFSPLEQWKRKRKKQLITVAKKISLQILPSTKHNRVHLARNNLCLEAIKIILGFRFFSRLPSLSIHKFRHRLLAYQCLAQHIWFPACCQDFTFSRSCASFPDLGEAYTFFPLTAPYVPSLVFSAFCIFAIVLR